METPTRVRRVALDDLTVPDIASISEANLSTPNKSDVEILLQRHPELSVASEDGHFNAVKGANVLFSRGDIIAQPETSNEKSNTGTGIGGGGNSTPPSNPFFHNSNFLRDPMIPYVISLYLQLLVNVTIIAVILIFGYKFVMTIRADIRLKEQAYIADTIQKISVCTQEYYRNRCDDRPVPAIQGACIALFKCMNQDPNVVAKSMITAETFADIVNGFIKPISWKSLIFMSCLLLGSLTVSNAVFGSYRSKAFNNEHIVKELQDSVREKQVLLEKYERLIMSRDQEKI